MVRWVASQRGPLLANVKGGGSERRRGGEEEMGAGGRRPCCRESFPLPAGQEDVRVQYGGC